MRYIKRVYDIRHPSIERILYIYSNIYNFQKIFEPRNKSLLRGLFKKFCYERLSIRKNNVCLTNFVHKYSSFYRTCICGISKESSKYQYSYYNVKWPQSYTLDYIWIWRRKSVEIGDVNFTKSRVAMKILPQKRDGEQTSEYNAECMLF